MPLVVVVAGVGPGFVSVCLCFPCWVLGVLVPAIFVFGVGVMAGGGGRNDSVPLLPSCRVGEDSGPRPVIHDRFGLQAMLNDITHFRAGSVPVSALIAVLIGVVCGIASYLYYTMLEFCLELFWKTIPDIVVVRNPYWPESLYWLWIPIVCLAFASFVGLAILILGFPGDLAYTGKSTPLSPHRFPRPCPRLSLFVPFHSALFHCRRHRYCSEMCARSRVCGYGPLAVDGGRIAMFDHCWGEFGPRGASRGDLCVDRRMAQSEYLSPDAEKRRPETYSLWNGLRACRLLWRATRWLPLCSRGVNHPNDRKRRRKRRAGEPTQLAPETTRGTGRRR